jgi:hypothetical protein
MVQYSCWLVLFILLGSLFSLYTAEFKSRNIDGHHFSATLWMKDHDVRYQVDVVFLKKAANIFFKSGQILPATVRNDRYMTLYLEKESMDSLSEIILKQVIPPDEIDEGNQDPQKWPVGAYWMMSIDLEKQIGNN